MSENDVPTRVEIQEVIDSALTRNSVYEFLDTFPVVIQEKIISDLVSYPGWENLVES